MDDFPTQPDSERKTLRFPARWPRFTYKRLLMLLATPKSATALAWGTSITFHVLLFTTAILVLPPIVRGLRETSQEQVIIPDATLSTDNDIGGVPNPGLGKDPTRNASQETDPSENDARGWAQRRSDDLAQALSASAVAANDVVAQNDRKQDPAKDNALFNLFGNDGGQMGSFGPRGGGQGIGPKSKIFGHGSNVRSIIYVCDASGSMVGQGDDALKTELKRDIANLSPIQQFNILIFHETRTGSQYQALTDKLIMGTPSSKATAFDFIDNLPFSSVNNPIPALEEAFREEPQLIFLLSHGDFNNRYNTTNNAEVLNKIEELNRDKKVHVNTVLLLGERRKEVERKDLELIMRNIAQGDGGALKGNGGTYNKYYSDDL
ncbi:MAG: hypothetical protein ABSB42_00090 [Tepidisphaeraceae bacterium]|jgi:hypothetical protein